MGKGKGMSDMSEQNYGRWALNLRSMRADLLQVLLWSERSETATATSSNSWLNSWLLNRPTAMLSGRLPGQSATLRIIVLLTLAGSFQVDGSECAAALQCCSPQLHVPGHVSGRVCTRVIVSPCKRCHQTWPLVAAVKPPATSIMRHLSRWLVPSTGQLLRLCQDRCKLSRAT